MFFKFLQKQFFTSFFIPIAFLLIPASSLLVEARTLQITELSLDFDDNIVYLNTPIYIFHKVTHEELALSTKQYAAHKATIGHSGPYADYVFAFGSNGSFRKFEDNATGEPSANLMEALKNAIQDIPENPASQAKELAEWQGPSWSYFNRALNQSESAHWVSIITARGHSPQSFTKAFQYLQELGYLKHLPDEENIYPITYKKRGEIGSIAGEKALRLLSRLDQIQALALGEDMIEVWDSDGIEKKRLHLFGFSDDDTENYQTCLQAVVKEVKNNSDRWKNIKIAFFLTSLGVDDVVIVRSDGTLRTKRADEDGEVTRIREAQNTP